ncbi:MAG: SDR family NAD(P)-dependent oxidoreductase [Burkholderiales bacterium]
MPLNEPIRNWNDQRVWVVGASTGIGRALAEALVGRGARVALTARSAGALEEIAAKAPAGRTLVLPADVTRAEDLERAHAGILSQWAGLDLVVFLAGNHRPMRAWELDTGAVRDLFEINVFGVLNGLRAVLPGMLKQQRGALAIVSSVAGYRGLPTGLAYGATKAALINLAETLYLDLAPKGIGVFLINPGFVKTPLTDKNAFTMPALITPEQAAREMLRGFERGEFEMHFPKRFTRVMKLLRQLSYRLYFPAVRRFTGL